MSVNKYRPHVWIIPEDDANRQIAVGFQNHEAFDESVVGLRAPAGGWVKVLEVFDSEYLPQPRKYPKCHVVMLIDFDDKADRAVQIRQRIPDDLERRVFFVGSKDEPEALRRKLGITFETIGRELADECRKGVFELWNHAHLAHNASELQRMVDVIKPICFPGA